METMEIEQVKTTFTPKGSSESFDISDLANMKIGTKLEGLLVIHCDELEYYEGTLEVQAEGVLFLESL